MVKELGKWSCNFGIKDALVKEPQIIGPGDCLPKTHGYANSQEDVYGLTPARCRKVKRRAQRQLEGLN